MATTNERRAKRPGGKIGGSPHTPRPPMSSDPTSVPTTVYIQGALDQFLAGDPAAKGRLITLAEKRLMVLARKLKIAFPTSPEETAGVVNEAYLKLHKALDEVRPGTVRQFFALASLQMRRVLLDLARANRRRGKRGSLNDSENPIDPPAPGGEDRDEVRDLFDAIDRLDEELREVVNLLFFQGLTQAEAAQVLVVHEDTVKRKWAKARVILAKYLAAFRPDAG